ncbi:MAG: hypothetical protein M8357_01830 [Desulfobulbaceae bacterium]|nr:hypothetical protein [Desulfobulbaceae bacterium]
MQKKLGKNHYLRIVAGVFVATVLLFGTLLNQPYAQDNEKENAAAQLSMSGWFSIIWGDSKDGKSSMIYTLTDEKGQQILLQVDEAVVRKLGGVLKFNGKYVNVEGTSAIPPENNATFDTNGAVDSAEKSPAVLKVDSITIAPSAKFQALTVNGITALAVSGSHPWVTIMCKFSDIANEPNDVAYFQGMYSDTQPGLNHYWKELSFNTADITGSTVGGTGWYTLPETELHYNPTDTEKGTDLSALADDCVAAADADVDYSLYSGINMMFNSDFDNGWAWGGSRTYTLDGVTKTWSITWEPPWSYHNISVIAHEMGHGFGLPHSSYDRAAVYDNPWDVMSQDRYNCAAATDPTYGCMAQHTISYHKDLLDWIPGPQKTTVATGAFSTITLEDLAAPTSTNYQMASIPIGGSATNFYTVEARRFTGYDAKLPAEGVVIHNVDKAEGIPAMLVPDGARTDPWSEGEIFIDETNSIAVMVNADTGTGFEVTISNGNLPPTSEAGGPYTEECMGSTTTVALDGNGSSDPEGFPLTYSWSTTCNGTFSDPTLAQPTLTVQTSDICNYGCSVLLTVTDNEGLSGLSDSAIVTIVDTTPPTLVGVPNDTTVECDAVPPPAGVTATDTCDASVIPGFEETRVDGSCADNYLLTRTWTGVDGCGYSSSAVQTITVQDTVGPVISCNNSATITPAGAPVSFTATATDNCAAYPSVEIIGYDCFKFTRKGLRVDKTDSCMVEVSGDTVIITDSGGVGDNIVWTARSNDNCGNVNESTCSVSVVKPEK